MSARNSAGPNHYGPNVVHAAQYRAIVGYVAKEGPCGFAKLFELFADPSETFYPSKTFRNRLTNLVERGDLVTNGSKGLRLWSVGDQHDCEPDRLAVKPLAPARRATTTPYTGVVAPPRQYNRLQGTYQPPRVSALRAGALDFAQLPSRGAGC